MEELRTDGATGMDGAAEDIAPVYLSEAAAAAEPEAIQPVEPTLAEPQLESIQPMEPALMEPQQQPTPLHEPVQAAAPAAAPPRKERSRLRTAVMLVVLGSVLGGFSLGAGFGAVALWAKIITPPTAVATPEPAITPTADLTNEVMAFQNQGGQGVSSLDDDLPGSFREVVQRVKPAIVCISAVMNSNQELFAVSQEPKGSGVIFKEDDEKVYIVTNYHVVGGAKSVSVRINDSELVEAGLIGKDKQADLAVLYVTKADLAKVGVTRVTVAPMGNSDRMQEGDIVLAIGNAMGEGNTTTQGIISVMSKDITVDNRQFTVIQTDAAINSGNSGGALVNMRGEVIGINTAKSALSSLDVMFGGSGKMPEGMGYSIASNVVIPVVNEIMLMKPKAFLGISGVTVSEEVAQLYAIPELGVLVEGVMENTAAAAAGMQRYDIITAFKGQPVFTMEELQSVIATCAVNETVEVKILRDGKKQMTLTVKLLASEDGSF